MKKRLFTTSIEMKIFKGMNLINKGIVNNTNGLKDYTIKEKYYNGVFFGKEFEVYNKKDFYIVVATKENNRYWTYDTRKDN